MKKIICLFFVCLFNNLGYSQTIITYAGGGQGDGLLAIDQSIAPFNVFNDSIGNVYFNSVEVGTGFTSIRKVDVNTGIISTIAGATSPLIASITGNATLAYIDHANIYICHNNYLKKINLNTNNVAIIAGNGVLGYSGDGGPATNAAISMSFYNRMCKDVSGDIYISDDINKCIRKIKASTNIISTFLNPSNAPFMDTPYGLCFDGSGNLYIGDYASHIVLKANTTTSVTSIFAGLYGSPGYTGDGGLATNARFNHPFDIKFDNGNLYICDDANNCIRQVNPSGIITSFINTGLNTPRGFCFDGFGNTYISNNLKIIKRNSTGILNVIAGNSQELFSGDGSLSTNASINNPKKLARDINGSIYFVVEAITPGLGVRIRKIDTTGIISTVAGGGATGYTGDGGLAINASFGKISDICIDQIGNLYIADRGNNNIRKVNLSTGIIATYAGNGTNTISGNGGPAINAGLGTILALAIDASGNLYISSSTVFNTSIRVIDATTGNISDFAGGGSSLGDGGLAINANVDAQAMCFDSQGNMIVADRANYRVRKITALTGIITTIAGNGSSISNTINYSNSANPLTSPLGIISSVYVGESDNIYIGVNRILKLNSSTNLLTAITGNNLGGILYNGTPVQYSSCSSLSMINDNHENIFFLGSGRIFKITTFCPASPTVTLGNDINQCNGSTTLHASSSNIAYYYWSSISANGPDSNIVNTNSNHIVTVTDNYGCSASDTINVQIQQCVWPGDVNNDQNVNSLDLLPIGVYYNISGGVIRPNASNNWVGQPSLNWSLIQQNGSDMKYADCNGDGQINFSDTTAIHLNSGLTHAAKLLAPNYVTTNPTGYFTFNKTIYNPGDTVKATFNLGSATNSLSNFYGASFNITYDVSNIKPNSESFSFLNSSWIGTVNNNSIVYSKINAGFIDASIVRINHINKNGYGSIAQFNFILNNTLTQTKLYLGVQNGIIINNSGNSNSFSSNLDSVALTPGTVTSIKNYSQNNLNIYPNPSLGSVTVEPIDGSKQLIIYNVLGERVYECMLTNVPVNVNLKSSGVYLFSITSSKGIISKRVIIEN